MLLNVPQRVIRPNMPMVLCRGSQGRGAPSPCWGMNEHGGPWHVRPRAASLSRLLSVEDQ